MEEKKKEDRRIRRTKSSLQQALRELAREKGYADVTVEEITNRAKLGRTTFYLHYQDKEDLLLEHIEEELAALVKETTKRPLSYWFAHENSNYLIEAIFSLAKENADLFKLVAKDQSNKVYDRLHKIISHSAHLLVEENPWAQKRIAQLSISLDFLIEYFSGAMWATIVWWTGNNFNPPAQKMASYFRQLFFPGLLSLLQAKEFKDLIAYFDTQNLQSHNPPSLENEHE